jgi:hypothetical protein
LDVDLLDTGLDLKVQIFQRIGILPQFMWLATGTRVIEDGHCLSDRGLSRDSTVNCHIRITGCRQNMVDLNGA